MKQPLLPAEIRQSVVVLDLKYDVDITTVVDRVIDLKHVNNRQLLKQVAEITQQHSRVIVIYCNKAYIIDQAWLGRTVPCCPAPVKLSKLKFALVSG